MYSYKDRLNLYSSSINKILFTKFMTAKASQNLNLMQKISTQWNQQRSKYVFSKVIECLEKPNTRMNTKRLKTNRL